MDQAADLSPGLFATARAAVSILFAACIELVEVPSARDEAVAAIEASATTTPEPAPDTEPEHEAGKAARTVFVALPGFAYFDPDSLEFDVGAKWYSHLVFGGLIETGNDGQPVNRTVESWEASPDLSEYTLNRLLNKESNSTLFNTLRNVERTVATDSHTVVISLQDTTLSFRLSFPTIRSGFSHPTWTTA